MTIEQFKKNWQPSSFDKDGYTCFCFNCDLNELKQNIRADAIDEFCNVLCSNGTIADFMKDYIIEKGEQLKEKKQ